MWTCNIGKVFEGMNLTHNNNEQIHLMKEMCKGEVLTALEAGIVTASYAVATRYKQLQDLARCKSRPTTRHRRRWRDDATVLHKAMIKEEGLLE
jgi:hypothetical protein